MLELVSGPKINPGVIATSRDFADRALGKIGVVCKDTPGFFGCRIGTYRILVAESEAIAMGLDFEEADAMIGKLFGIPSTGIFGVLDLVGVDLMLTTPRNLQNTLPNTDADHEYGREPLLISRMIDENRLSRQSGAGISRGSPDRPIREITDVTMGDGRPQRQIASEGDVREEHPGLRGRYALVVMKKALAYAASLVPEVAESPYAVDDAMRTGAASPSPPISISPPREMSTQSQMASGIVSCLTAPLAWWRGERADDYC